MYIASRKHTDKGTTMLKLLITTVLLVSFSAGAEQLHSYYPVKLAKMMESTQANHSGEALRDYLFKVLNSSHQKVKGQSDKLGCGNGNGECYSQRSLGYKSARKVLFGKLHLDKDQNGYYIKDVYCRKEFRRSQTRMGPGQIPNSNILISSL